MKLEVCMLTKPQETFLNCVKEKRPRIQACHVEFITEQLLPPFRYRR